MSDGADPSAGDRVDAAVENLRTEVNSRIDGLQQTVEQLSAKIDAAQGQGQVQGQSQAQPQPQPQATPPTQ